MSGTIEMTKKVGQTIAIANVDPDLVAAWEAQGRKVIPKRKAAK